MPLNNNFCEVLNKNYSQSLEYTFRILFENIEEKLIDSSHRGYNYAVLYDESIETDKRIWFENPITLYEFGSLRNFIDTKISLPFWVILYEHQLRLYWKIN
jgi:hypothetical protein